MVSGELVNGEWYPRLPRLTPPHWHATKLIIFREKLTPSAKEDLLLAKWPIFPGDFEALRQLSQLAERGDLFISCCTVMLFGSPPIARLADRLTVSAQVSSTRAKLK